ncbi:MAG: ParB/RepB/Spo0J family partition protein [Patescibacteria group bacterium]|jgi:ParB family chromosome partitioning protein
MKNINTELRANDELREVEITKISINPSQPRRVFSQEEIEELAASIVAVGLIQPPIVRLKDNADNEYELIAGERRWRASHLAGLKKIFVVVRDINASFSAQAALIENIQRVDLNPIEVALALRDLIDNFGLRQDDVAQRIGKKRSTVANYLRLLALPKHIQDSISQNTITMGHAKLILSLEGLELQALLHEMILRDDLTVRETEEAVTRLTEKSKTRKLSYKTRDFHLEQLAEKMQQKLGTKVSIQGQGKRGRITIGYYSFDDLDRVLALFGIGE